MTEKVTVKPTVEKKKTTEEAIPKTKFKFDRSFQEKIVQAMIMDRHWAGQFSEVLNVDFFEYAHLKLIADKYVSYQQKYKEFPSQELLLTIVRDELKTKNDAGLKSVVKDFFIRVELKSNLGDLSFVKDKSLEFCKKASLQVALAKSVDFIETERYEKIVGVIQEAISAGNDHTPGLRLLEDVDARYSETYRKTVPTGQAELDGRKILNGGLGSGEIGIVVAPTGVGKSHLLVDFGCSGLKHKKNVIHYTFELNERMTGIRYDSNMMDIPSLNCFEHRDKIKKHYEDNKDKLGKLIVKYYPPSQATVQTLRTHIEKVQLTGFVPDLILVDYAGIMRSADRNELLRLELKKVCEELRTLATDLDIPIWTALQSNKEGATSEIIDLTNMAESYAQAHVADFVLGLSRQSAEKSTGFGNIFVAKNRAGIDGIKYFVHLDTGKSKLRIMTDAEAASMKEVEPDERKSGLDYMQKKFRNMQ